MVGVGEHMFETRGVEAVWCTQKGGGGIQTKEEKGQVGNVNCWYMCKSTQYV